MSHFDTSQETSILVDASPVGLSAILTQKDPQQNTHNIIAYASRASPLLKNDTRRRRRKPWRLSGVSSISTSMCLGLPSP